MHIVKIRTTDIVSMKSVLIGGTLLDCFNNQDDNVTVLVIKDGQVLEITLISSTLKKPKARLIRQLSSPIEDIVNNTVMGDPVVVFVIGDVEFDFEIVPKKLNHLVKYDELCMMEGDVIDLSNYKTFFPGHHLSNYESVKEELEYGINLPAYGLYQEFTSPTGTLAIVQGESKWAESKLTLIFEKVNKG